MPKRGSEKTYSSINNAYVLIILIILMGIAILGAIAFPYYISPITYSNGGQPQAGGIAVLAAIIIMGAIAGVYFIENRNYELGGILLVLALLIIAVYVWVSYGSGAIKFIFNI
ncbi:hypothetical protein [Stygiolobus caldivivus]|uniref:Uncharacterized protein n=1 Tax=Stygiolobus caldivivus TaxID=2824673 RepID=A0A8D5U7P2_9CREN|nr:hypothetical protein [Stygiolobus caldivivus]BCU70492.1 hypothetical protein KN1_17890 [Stygiolobus caldivivus]